MGTPGGPGWARLSTDACSPVLPTDRGLPRGFSAPAHDAPHLARRERCFQNAGHPSFQKEPHVGPFLEPLFTAHQPGWGWGSERGERALPSAQLLWAGLVTAPSQGVSWRHLCCRPYLEGTGDGSGTFLNSVIISQERLRPRGPSQARMWPLALQTAAQSTPPAGCHWLHRVPRWVGEVLGFPALVKTERWGWREGDRGRWHSEMQAAVLQAEVDTPMAIKPGPPLAWTPLLSVWPSWPL